MIRSNSGTLAIPVFLFASCVLLADAMAQAPIPPQTIRPGVMQPGFPVLPELEGKEAFRAYQACVAAHRNEVDLHNAAKQIVEIRETREMVERALKADPRARERFPGGVDEAIAGVFASYKSLGGSARSLADVREVPTPCPVPRPDPTRRLAPRGSGSVSARAELAVPPGGDCV